MSMTRSPAAWVSMSPPGAGFWQRSHWHVVHRSTHLATPPTPIGGALGPSRPRSPRQCPQIAEMCCGIRQSDLPPARCDGLTRRGCSSSGENGVRILHVNKFVYRRGGAEVHARRGAAAARSRPRGRAVRHGAPRQHRGSPAADTFPPEVELEPAPRGLAGVTASARMVWSLSSSHGMARALELPAGRRALPQHLPPALPVDPRASASRRRPLRHDAARLQAGLPELPDARPRTALRRLCGASLLNAARDAASRAPSPPAPCCRSSPRSTASWAPTTLSTSSSAQAGSSPG